jgi:phosphoribosylanthranilate isomerase
LTKVKICGIHSLTTVPILNELQPDLVGFVFAKSKRQVQLQEALTIKQELSPTIKTVGVFVNPTFDQIVPLIEQQVIELVQLHGRQDQDLVEQIQKMGVQVTQVIHVTDHLTTTPDFVMYDGQQPGSGQKIDWDLIQTNRQPFFLAGGLTPDNVQQAIQTVQPDYVDVSSGVETDGQKDPEKIRQFIRRARNARS